MSEKQDSALATLDANTFNPTNYPETVIFSLACAEYFKNDIYGNGHYLIYKEIYNVYNNNTKYFIDEEDSIKTLKLLNSLYISDEKKKWINTRENIESKRLGKYSKNLMKLYM